MQVACSAEARSDGKSKHLNVGTEAGPCCYAVPVAAIGGSTESSAGQLGDCQDRRGAAVGS